MAGWFRTRVDLDPLIAMVRRKPVPVHRHTWMYTLGDALVFLLALQAASGTMLLFYYQPTEAAAHESVRRIMTEVPYGWLFRSMHVWGASLLVLFVGLHLISVLFARAYRRPRELAWISGVLMLFAVMASGFTGYLLPWNGLSYYATRVGTQLPGKLPGVGPFLVRLLRGGDQLTGETITRFFAAHVMLAPLTLLLLLGLHVFLSRVRGVGLPLGMRYSQVRDHRPFFTEFLLIDAILWLVLAGAVVTLSVIWPAAIGAAADPLQPAPEGIRPEWYFLFLFQVLKVLPEWAGLSLFGLIAAGLVVLPFVDRRAQRGEKNVALTVVFLLLLGCAAVLQVTAWIAPGPRHPQEQFAAPTWNFARGLVSLALVWGAIGLVAYALWRLLNENARARRLRGPAGRQPMPGPQSPALRNRQSAE
jgi:cytochrome b6